MANTNKPVQDILATLDANTLKDSEMLFEIMLRISDAEPKIWNEHTIGFDQYHYKYDSGREGDSQILSFYPRKGKITVYLMDGTARYAELLDKLGSHTTTGYCIVIKRLSDIEIPILEQILQQSYDYIKSMSKAGSIDKILWKTEK
jgi:Domain of unknown function (DU1801)